MRKPRPRPGSLSFDLTRRPGPGSLLVFTAVCTSRLRHLAQPTPVLRHEQWGSERICSLRRKGGLFSGVELNCHIKVSKTVDPNYLRVNVRFFTKKRSSDSQPETVNTYHKPCLRHSAAGGERLPREGFHPSTARPGGALPLVLILTAWAEMPEFVDLLKAVDFPSFSPPKPPSPSQAAWHYNMGRVFCAVTGFCVYCIWRVLGIQVEDFLVIFLKFCL